MISPLSPFALLIFETVVPYFRANPHSVSPFRTKCLILLGLTTTGLGFGLAAGTGFGL